MQIQSYLSFNGNCGDAIAFYREALGAEQVFRLRFDEAPSDARPPAPPELADKVMHAALRIGESMLLMSDGGCVTKKNETFAGMSLFLGCEDASTAERHFNALAQSGEVKMPFQETFWSPGFGMVTDRFGVPWMVSAPPAGKIG